MPQMLTPACGWMQLRWGIFTAVRSRGGTTQLSRRSTPAPSAPSSGQKVRGAASFWKVSGNAPSLGLSCAASSLMPRFSASTGNPQGMAARSALCLVMRLKVSRIRAGRLPSAPIRVVGKSDTSGTNLWLTSYLQTGGTSTISPNASVLWPACVQHVAATTGMRTALRVNFSLGCARAAAPGSEAPGQI